MFSTTKIESLEQAWEILRKNFTETRGGLIVKKDESVSPTPDEFAAIDYLCDEWDYGWEPRD